MKLKQIVFLNVLIPLVRSLSEHRITFKNLHRGLLECTEMLRIPEDYMHRAIKNGFPDDEQTKLLVRCSMIILHSWDDTLGLQRSALSTMFAPTAYEGLFEIRTTLCLANELATVDEQDFLKRAYVTFHCFYREYGNVANNVQFVAQTDKQLESNMIKSIAIASIPRSALEQVNQRSFLEMEDFRCLLYIFSLRAGFYSNIGGMLLYNMFSQYGNGSLVTFDKITCVQTVFETSKFASKCTLVNAVFSRCLLDTVPIEKLIASASTSALRRIL